MSAGETPLIRLACPIVTGLILFSFCLASVDYTLEYGSDTVEVHVDAIEKGTAYLIVDDLLATGGTADASCRLIEKGGGVVVACLFLVELPDLDGRKKLKGRKVVSIIQFEGE